MCQYILKVKSRSCCAKKRMYSVVNRHITPSKIVLDIIEDYRVTQDGLRINKHVPATSDGDKGESKSNTMEHMNLTINTLTSKNTPKYDKLEISTTACSVKLTTVNSVKCSPTNIKM